MPENVLAAEQRAFRRKFAQLLERYEGKYVALYKERVVALGKNDEKLALQLYRKLGDVPFYIAKVEKEPTIYELPSPFHFMRIALLACIILVPGNAHHC